MTAGAQAKVTSSGQISLPATLRRRWGVTRVLIVDRGDYALVRPMPDDVVAFLRGSVSASGQSLEDIRADERAADAQREESR
ncbi:MAG: AbrB/MazE/SpoVT family DNA-binding domain-containing protein [Candidatus Nanopelagicales bacterium]|jgi:bifunctional DNA-binding transcriptional regulator/antitoxin component of YhaV-PrlF toxin-antitoxin module|nr:AbrB/MazE/SpoVT family DNA-binding domain-containing protein [Candidatus Nanopelagicales bacterium]MDP5094800.1 AbrB/MazE/SpoVT family DNA-binding domain-containing protein [Candidatus Nanopelagicales bacterium]